MEQNTHRADDKGELGVFHFDSRDEHENRAGSSIKGDFYIVACILERENITLRLTGPHAFGPKKIYFGHKILMKQPHDSSYLPMGGRPN